MTDLPVDLATAIGLAGTFGGCFWPLIPSRRGMLLAQAGTACAFSWHFLLLSAWTGTLMNALGALQVLAAIPLGSRPGFRIIYLATLPVIAGGLAATWQGPQSAFAALALAFMSLGRYQRTERSFRLWFLVALPCWFGHDLMVGSVPALIADLVGFTNCAIMVIRDCRRPA